MSLSAEQIPLPRERVSTLGNIRDVLGRYPGMRLLAIVGASHKGYYEAYLNQMHDVRLIDARTILR